MDDKYDKQNSDMKNISISVVNQVHLMLKIIQTVHFMNINTGSIDLLT
jgi:hypothetical protein